MHLKKENNQRPLASCRGSALITVAIVSSMIVLLIGSMLQYSLSERKLNSRHVARLEARNAAEALAEFGAAQIRQKYETRGTFTLNPNGTDALQQPPASFWTGTNVVPTKSDLTGATYPPVTSLDLELMGGTERKVTTGTSDLYFVDPADENNANDPLINKWVTRRDVTVVARASVRPASGGNPITAYVGQTISVRGAPLFAHAIFYNMDLEIYNGPPMTISGPVHTNGNLHVFPDQSLTFSSNVTATGKIFHAGKKGDTQDGAGGAARTGSVNFPNRAKQSVNLFGKDVLAPGADFWRDSTGGSGPDGTSFANFAANASQVFNGYLQTGEHGIQNYTPVAIGKYVEDPTPSDGVDNSINTGRLIIEPPAIPSSTDLDYAKKMEVEEQKYSNTAGVYITVEPGTGTITVSSRGKNNDGSLKTPKPLVLPAGTDSKKLVSFKPYNLTTQKSVQTRTYSWSTTRESRTNDGRTEYRYKRKFVPSTVPTNTVVVGNNGQVSNTPIVALPTVGSEVIENTFSGWTTSNTPPVTAPRTPTTHNIDAHSVTSGMYDQHRAKGIDLVEIDISALKDVVTEMQKPKSDRNPTLALNGATSSEEFSSADWNGIIYVDIQGGPTTRVVNASASLPAGSTVAATNPNNTTTGVRLINGSGKLPTYGTTNPGLTIASNAPVYIKGHYNADGVTNSGNPATDPEPGEVPAAVVSDAITVLSPGFNDSTSFTSASPAASESVEVAAAFLMGIAPTNKNGNGKTSGGAHNIVRFLENWSNKTTWFRGSLVCLFESRVFTEPHGGNYYSPPNRNWGFSNLFRQGTYPPGTPRVLSYRRVDFTDMTASQYDAMRESFNW
jgi:hypothetical protein